MSPLELAIRDHAWSFVRGELSRDEFMDWFAPILMEAADADPVARDLADEIALYDSEFTSGAGMDADLREAIRLRLHVYRGFTLATERPWIVSTGSDNLNTPAASLSIGAGR